jgi:hypothetical protein
MILIHCVSENIYKTSINDLLKSEICKHPENSRALYKEDLKVILEDMLSNKHCSM